jgi:hypothetical protein
MLDSVNRAMGTTDKDWEITHQPTLERYQEGLKQMQSGDRRGFAKAMYARGFYPNGDGDYETCKGLANGVLGLPQEDFDLTTKEAVEWATSGWSPLLAS